jgi:hypothetical protein
VTDFDDLFYAVAKDVAISSDVTVSVPISFVRNANTLKVTINGLDKVALAKEQESRAGVEVPLNVFLLGKNGRYDVDNQIDDNAQIVRYEPQYLDYNLNGTSMTVYVKTMRLDIVRHTLDPVLLYIQTPDGSNLVEPVDILWAILQARDVFTGKLLYPDQESIDRQEEFVINLNIELTDSGLKISLIIDGWVIIELKPEVEAL